MPGPWPWAGETRCLSLRRHTGGGHSWGLRAQEEMRDVGAEARARPGSCPRVAGHGGTPGSLRPPAQAPVPASVPTAPLTPFVCK